MSKTSKKKTTRAPRRKKNIYQRLAAVRKAMGPIEKDTEIRLPSGKTYRAVSHDAVIGASRELLLKEGVHIEPQEEESRVVPLAKTAVRFEAVYRVRFINIDQPDDVSEVRVTGHGVDSQDKAPGKALSYAVKNAILKQLQMQTGENDEVREIVDVDPLTRPDQAQEIRALIKQIPEGEKRLNEYLRRQGFGPDVAQIKARNAAVLISLLRGVARKADTAPSSESRA